MAKVFTGRVVIPGDQIEAYFQAMAEAEKAREPFRKHLESLNQEFEDHLATKYVPKTVRKHGSIVALFIDFICHYTDVQSIEEITKGMVNSHFRSWYRRKVLDSATESDLRVALRKFFQFLASEKGITNQKALDALK
ncbi:site-specific integrase [Leptothermofonsia sichuanensis E412]|uniref:site-specific integrase n=1 Tax=Leptothermofonsia sichuanensis TaxID=2917832 RepID=UPI001CA69A73|nr:site-specific integrase [Leptothermofonsia sichuanensis]QZZ22704.1 site-specific integrase [Leptothermofonsia sichuanensis E412]